jgi:hypothetical protein
MGIYEDDRIRNKNRVHNAAYTLYENLKKEGLTNLQIRDYARSCINEGALNFDRNDVYLTVINIVGESNNETFNKSSDAGTVDQCSS